MNTSGKLLKLNNFDFELQVIQKMDQEHFPRPWTSLDWTELDWPHHLLYAWELNKKIEGFTLCSFVPGDDVMHLLKIYLNPALRGQGIAHEFWQSCLSEIKKTGVSSVYLEVEANNHQALNFYKKEHFKVLRLVKGYYSDGADAVTMQMTI